MCPVLRRQRRGIYGDPAAQVLAGIAAFVGGVVTDELMTIVFQMYASLNVPLWLSVLPWIVVFVSFLGDLREYAYENLGYMLGLSLGAFVFNDIWAFVTSWAAWGVMQYLRWYSQQGGI
jgi:hypothetical protein